MLCKANLSHDGEVTDGALFFQTRLEPPRVRWRDEPGRHVCVKCWGQLCTELKTRTDTARDQEVYYVPCADRNSIPM